MTDDVTIDVKPDVKREAWEASYGRGENFLFLPDEAVVRFAARHVAKRVGPDRWQDRMALGRPPRMLDLCCGIGRHAMFFLETGCDVRGCDLSATAVAQAVAWAEERGYADAAGRFRTADASALPYEDGAFDVVVSHASLDSMPLAVARRAVAEARRVLTPGGRAYFDFISGDDGRHAAGFAGEEVVDTPHERGTVQTYFNEAAVTDLLAPHFEVTDLTLVQRLGVTGGTRHGRWHAEVRPAAGPADAGGPIA